jgi:hypothetical protein
MEFSFYITVLLIEMAEIIPVFEGTFEKYML